MNLIHSVLDAVFKPTGMPIAPTALLPKVQEPVQTQIDPAQVDEFKLAPNAQRPVLPAETLPYFSPSLLRLASDSIEQLVRPASAEIKDGIQLTRTNVADGIRNARIAIENSYSLFMKFTGLDPKPFIMLLSVTELCQAHCDICVFPHGAKHPLEMTVEERDELFRQFRAAGGMHVHLWGGEPTLDKRLGDIVRSAKKHGLYVSIISNGGLVKAKVDDLAELNRLNLSIDAPNAEAHDEFRGKPGLFKLAIDGIKAFKEKYPNKPVMVGFTLTSKNKDMVKEMAELCKKLGAQLYVNPVRAEANVAVDVSAGTEANNPNHKSLEKSNASITMSFEDQVEVWKLLKELKKSGYPIYNSLTYINEVIRQGLLGNSLLDFVCYWPKMAIEINSNGDLVDCSDWKHPLTNIRLIKGKKGINAGLKSLREILDSKVVKDFQKKLKDCRSCISPSRVDPSNAFALRAAALWNYLTN